MKKSILFAMFLFFEALAGSAAAQTAAQYTDAGNQSYAAKDFAKAVLYYQAAANLDPNSAAAFQGLGNSQYSLGQNNEAIVSYEKALRLNPNNVPLASFVQSLKAKVAAAPASSIAVPSPGSASPAAGGTANKFELDVDAGLMTYGGQIGFGGGLGGFVPLDKSFAIGAMANFFTVSVGASVSAGGASASSSSSMNFIEGVAAVKYRFEGASMRPYVFGGAGIADVISSYSSSASSGGTTITGSASSTSSIDPMLLIGGGLEFSGGKDMNIFAQVTESIIIVPGTSTTVNVGGYSTIVSGGGGTASYTGVQGGLNFNL